ncbi:30S ribosomal protein S2 [Candidatus Omnitrophota bacterium]
MTEELIRQLLEAGVHFGHQAKRWNPKMAKFIFGERKGIYIIDLEKTLEALNQAREFLKDIASKGQTVLFAGTKKQAQEVIKEEALRCKMFYVNKRWLGGLLTNFQTIRKSVARMMEIESMENKGLFEKITKKEIASLTKEKEKLGRNLLGVRDMEQLPGAVFVVDSKKEETAVREARKLSIPVVGLIDTNCDPDLIDFPIPGNDDALKSIHLVTHLLSESIIAGREKFLKDMATPIAEERKESEAAPPVPEEGKEKSSRPKKTKTTEEKKQKTTS